MYCTLDDIKKRIPEETLIQLTDDENLGVVDQAVIDAVIADADELIDGHLRGRYVLPMAPAPGMLRTVSIDLAIYSLYGRRPEFGIPESVAAKYKAQMDVLKRIQKGEITLGAAGITAPVEAAAGGTVSAPERLFSRDTLDRY